MRAAHRFVAGLERDGLVDRADEVIVDLSRFARGHRQGHGTDTAVLPVWLVMSRDGGPARGPGLLDGIRTSGRLALGGRHDISYDEPRHLRWHLLTRLPAHPNGMTFIARSKGEVIREREYYRSAAASSWRRRRPSTMPSSTTTPRSPTPSRPATSCSHGVRTAEVDRRGDARQRAVLAHRGRGP